VSELERLAQQFKDALDAQDEQALTRIVTAYSRILRNLQGNVDALLMEVASLDNPTASQIRRLSRYNTLIDQGVTEITRFQSYLATEIINGAELSFGLSAQQSLRLLQESGIQAQLGNLPTNAFETIVSFLQEGSPLYGRIELLAGTSADYVMNALLEGVALGKNPRTIARLIQDAFGRGLTDALRLARTAMLWASRVATAATYQPTADVLDGWVWFATLDESVCQSCIVQHGTIHQLDEVLNDHHYGRCAAIPYIEAFGNPVEQTGIDWFEAQSEEKQKKIPLDLSTSPAGVLVFE
jgi:hypothetical protein